MRYQIVNYPDPVLSQVARDVTDSELSFGMALGHDLKILVSEMTALMREGDRGIGLSAPQVGVPLRIFVVDATQRKTDPLVFINPKLSGFSKDKERKQEGCLSLPGIVVSVDRHKALVVTAKRLDGTAFPLVASDMLARVVQHEQDHLDGVLIEKYATLASRPMVNKKLQKFEEAYSPIRSARALHEYRERRKVKANETNCVEESMTFRSNPGLITPPHPKF